MKTLVIAVPFMMFAASAFAVAPNAFQVGPKNLVSPTYRAPAAQAPHELTKRDINKLTKTAETAADHRKIAEFYRAEGNRLDALAAAYEKGTASYRAKPQPKNLGSPTTPGRDEFVAKGFRKDAAANHAIADSHEEMARNAAGF